MSSAAAGALSAARSSVLFKLRAPLLMGDTNRSQKGFHFRGIPATRPRAARISDWASRAVTVKVSLRLSAADARRLAARIMVLAGVGVAVLFVLAWASDDPDVPHVFDVLHWTVAYVAAAIVAWLGVFDATGVDRASRRWFALGLTLTAAGQLVYDYRELTGSILLYELSDSLFLVQGPCFLIGLALALRKHRRLQLRTFLLDVFALGLVLLTLILDLYLPRHGSM